MVDDLAKKSAAEACRNKFNEEVLAETIARGRARVIEVCLLKIDCSIRGH